MRKVLVIGQSAVAIIWEAEEITGLMENLFFPWHNQKEEAEFTVLIERKAADYRVSMEGAFSSRVEKASLVTTMEQVITQLASEILSDCLLIHAAVIDFNGSGIIISGQHGSGKTTLALTALSSGCTALTDEVAVLCRDTCTLQGFPRPFRVREGTLALKPSIIPMDCPRTVSPEGITHVFISAPGLPYYQPQTQTSLILFPVRRPGKTVVRDISEREALESLFPQGFNFHLRPDGCLFMLIALIRNHRAMEIGYSDHWHAIHTLQDIILRSP